MIRKSSLLLGLIALLTLINYLDRSAIAYPILALQQEFFLDAGEFGLILGVYGIGYLVSLPAWGLLIDRCRCYRVWALGAIGWSISMLFLSLAQGFWSLFLCRFLLGLFEGVHFPAMQRTIHDWLPPPSRAKALSVSLSGVPVASLIGSPLMTTLFLAFGWRTLFFLLAAAGLLWAALWMLFFTCRKPRATPFPSASRQRIDWKAVLRLPAFQVSCLSFFAFGYIVFFILLWLPGYFEQARGIHVFATGIWIMLPWGASLLALIAGGWISDRIKQATGSIYQSRSLLISLGFLGAGASFLGVLYVETLGMTALLISLGLSSAFFINAPLYALNTDLFGPNIGKIQGVISAFFALSGVIGPTLTGYLIDLFGSFNAAIGCVAALSLAAAFFSAINRNVLLG